MKTMYAWCFDSRNIDKIKKIILPLPFPQLAEKHEKYTARVTQS